jgi:hypothetical protein
MTTGKGFLAIWSDVKKGDETDYLHWLTREHTAERVSIPGFLGVRVFRARFADPCRFFILYELEEPGVIGSGPYLERLNAPTEWSRRIMPSLRNFIRGGGRVVAEVGYGRGATVCPVVCEANEVTAARAVLARVASLDRVAAARLFEVERSGTDIATNEKSIRENDRSFPALLVVDMLDDEPLDAACREIQKALRRPASAALYDHVFALDRDDIAGTEAP